MTTTLLDRPSPIHDDATRRQFLIGGASMAALLAGCATSTVPAADDRSGDGRFPVTIEHRFGSTTIPAAPSRVVVAGLVEQDPLLALGVVPVATTEWFGEHPGAIHPWAREALGDAPLPEVLSIADGFEFERIAALRPDLIVGLLGGPETRGDYDKLARIAPIVTQPAGLPPPPSTATRPRRFRHDTPSDHSPPRPSPLLRSRP